jgi:hypothetical protein
LSKTSQGSNQMSEYSKEYSLILFGKFQESAS